MLLVSARVVEEQVVFDGELAHQVLLEVLPQVEVEIVCKELKKNSSNSVMSKTLCF